MKFIVDNNELELILIDPQSGIDYSNDFFGGYLVDGQKLSKDDFDWYQDVVEDQQKLDILVNKLIDDGHDRYDVYSIIAPDMLCDMEYQASNALDTLKSHFKIGD